MINSALSEKLKGSITKTMTVAVVTQLVRKYLLKMEFDIFDNKWVVGTFATAAGFAVHDLFTYRLNKYVTFKNTGAQRAVKDVLYFGTMMIVKDMIMNHVYQQPITKASLLKIGIALAGFVGYDLLISTKQPKLEKGSKFNSTFGDTIKSVSAILISDFLPDQDIDMSTLPHLFSILCALPVYHLVTGPMVANI